jgi:hypothetical protein
MLNRAFLFPGQGSQYEGMGADVIVRWPRVRRWLQRLEDLTGCPIVDVMLHGPGDRLKDTALSQLAIFGMSTALWDALASGGIRPALVEGTVSVSIRLLSPVAGWMWQPPRPSPAGARRWRAVAGNGQVLWPPS